MKRKIDWRSFWWGWVCEGALILVLQLLLLLCGCTPTRAPDLTQAEEAFYRAALKSSEPAPKQRVEDLQHPCERCGEPATENVSEVADEFNWRCDRCKPRDVMPRRVPRLKSRKLETQIAMENEHGTNQE